MQVSWEDLDRVGGDKLGAGSFGSVFKAKLNMCPVAVKELHVSEDKQQTIQRSTLDELERVSTWHDDMTILKLRQGLVSAQILSIQSCCSLVIHHMKSEWLHGSDIFRHRCLLRCAPCMRCKMCIF